MGNSYARGLLFRRLSALSGLDINSNTVSITSIAPSTSKAGNTQIVLESASGSFFKGRKVFHYDRNPITTPIDELIIEIGTRQIAWTWELVDLLYANTGVRHLKEEIVNERLSDPVRPFIKFSPTHPVWLGGFYVTLVTQKPTEPCKVDLGSPTLTIVNAMYDHVNFSGEKGLLRNVKPHTDVPESFCELLNSKTSLQWEYQPTEVEHNLKGAKVIYNGPAKDLLLAKHRHLNVLRIALSSEYSTAVCGELSLYY